ncbi:hypothetical protein [Mangrovibacterium marinum]|uniref:NACHT domain-containing protein n=1 Tax=Mangrovibacterium marinum TaxID=1639118 RepID=A0A2T5C286_9BACT|nr:hypothetical protein [Mangrovibacterium marinum]PTN08777.1 hypothetical protein C8N47_107137 [Mangrovibacterium marinum]
MKKQENLIKELVKDEIRKKYGQQISAARDCQTLAESILESTGRQISVSTLKRFFGIIQSPFNPSKYTLNTLAIYLGFSNWTDYAVSFEKNKHKYSSLNSWEQLKKRACYLSNNSMLTIGSRIKSEQLQHRPRAFAIEKLEGFMQSSQVATAFIAPGGYGKSTLIYQCAEYFFLGPDARYPNDIAMLLDGGSLISIVNKFDQFNWLHNLLLFKPENSFSKYFREHPDEVKGHFVLIIDALNEIFYHTDKLSGFIENLLDIVSSYEEVPWFKLIITCQPDNWKILSCLARKKPAVTQQWFDVSFDELPELTINVPLLTKTEIKRTLEQKYPKQFYRQLSFHSPQLLKIIARPYFLNLFMQQEEAMPGCEIDLLHTFLSETILSEPYAAEKFKIIDSLLQHSQYGKRITPVQKDELPQSDEYKSAYRELISRNIIYEQNVPCSYLSVTTEVRFSNDILMEFMLANKWLRENQFNLNLIRKINDYYSENKLLRFNLIKFIIKIAFKERKADFLKDIFSIFEDTNPAYIRIKQTDVDSEIFNLINIELRKHPELRDYLIPHFAQSRAGQILYFESFFDMDSLVLHAGDNINYYLENKPGPEAQIYGHHLKFTQYFLTSDREKQREEYDWFKAIEKPQLLNPLTSGFYHSVRLLFEPTISKEHWTSILHQAEQFYLQESQQRYNFPIFEYLLINALNYKNNFDKIRELVQLTTERYILTKQKSNWLYQLIISFNARAMLHTGDEERATETFRQTELKSIAPNYKYYAKIRYLLVQVEFLEYARKIEEALAVLTEIKAIAQMLRFKYFYDQASEYERKLKTNSSGENSGRKRKNLKAH